MRVKVLLVLALASLILSGSAGITLAADSIPGISGLPSFSGINDLAGVTGSNFGYPALVAKKTSPDTSSMMDWISGPPADNSLPDLSGYVPDALLTESPIGYGADNSMAVNAGVPASIVSSSGPTEYETLEQSLGFDATINNLISQLGLF